MKEVKRLKSSSESSAFFNQQIVAQIFDLQIKPKRINKIFSLIPIGPIHSIFSYISFINIHQILSVNKCFYVCGILSLKDRRISVEDEDVFNKLSGFFIYLLDYFKNGVFDLRKDDYALFRWTIYKKSQRFFNYLVNENGEYIDFKVKGNHALKLSVSTGQIEITKKLLRIVCFSCKEIEELFHHYLVAIKRGHSKTIRFLCKNYGRLLLTFRNKNFIINAFIIATKNMDDLDFIMETKGWTLNYEYDFYYAIKKRNYVFLDYVLKKISKSKFIKGYDSMHHILNTKNQEYHKVHLNYKCYEIILKHANHKTFINHSILPSVRDGRVKCVEFLLKRECDTEGAIELSSSLGSLEITKLLFKNLKISSDEIFRSCIKAIFGGNCAVLKFLLMNSEYRIDVKSLICVVYEKEKVKILTVLLNYSKDKPWEIAEIIAVLIKGIYKLDSKCYDLLVKWDFHFKNNMKFDFL